MASSKILEIMTDSFLDGITGAALFGKVRLPGSPTVLVDTRSAEEAFPALSAFIREFESVRKKLARTPASRGRLTALDFGYRTAEVKETQEQKKAEPKTDIWV
jgi:hypothetical protein